VEPVASTYRVRQERPPCEKMVQIWDGTESVREPVGVRRGANFALLKMEAALFSETSVHFCHTAQLHIPENIVFKNLQSFTSSPNLISSTGTTEVTSQSYFFFTMCEISVKMACILQIKLKMGLRFETVFSFLSSSSFPVVVPSS
jgi:hypothetical protein